MEFKLHIPKWLITTALICAPLVTGLVALHPVSALAQAVADVAKPDAKPTEALAATPAPSSDTAPTVTHESVDNPYGIKAMPCRSAMPTP